MERAVYQLVREQLRDSSISPGLLFCQAHGHYLERAQQLSCPVTVLDLPHGHAIRRLPEVSASMANYDVHHFHSGEPLLMLASRRVHGACRVYTHRGGPMQYSWKKRLQYELTGVLLRHAFHGFSGNTIHAARFAARLLRIDPRVFQVTYNGLDFNSLEPRRPPEATRAELGLDRTCFVLGTVAHLRPWKRIDRLLVAASEVQHPELRVLVVGDGPDRSRLEALSAELGIAGGVLFRGWQREMGEMLQIMDAFCLPSMGHESFGNAAVEAMAMGVPTLVFSDGGGLLEHVTDGKTGFVIDSQSELQSTIRRLIADRALGTRIGSEGRVAVRHRYTLARSASAYRRLYESALSSCPGRPLPSATPAAE